jgi:hypothetical protein
MLSPGGVPQAPTPSVGPSTVAALVGQLAGTILALLAALNVVVIDSESTQLITGAAVALASLVTMVVSRTSQTNRLAQLQTAIAIEAEAAPADPNGNLERAVKKLHAQVEGLRVQNQQHKVDAAEAGWTSLTSQAVHVMGGESQDGDSELDDDRPQTAFERAMLDDETDEADDNTELPPSEWPAPQGDPSNHAEGNPGEGFVDGRTAAAEKADPLDTGQLDLEQRS